MKLNEHSNDYIYCVEDGETLVYATNKLDKLKDFIINGDYEINNKNIKIYTESSFYFFVCIETQDFFKKITDTLYGLTIESEYKVYSEIADKIINMLEAMQNLDFNHNDYNIISLKNLDKRLNEDTLYKCTVCGRIGNVGRCCGDETHIPLNEKAKEEFNASNNK